jgi:hypothetical protein
MAAGMAILFGTFDSTEGAPSKSSLSEARGRVTSWRSGRYSTDFALDGSSCRFSYGSKSGERGRVDEALKTARDSVGVRYVAQTPSWYRERTTSCSVYEIAVGDRLVRSWDEVDRSIREDNALSPWLTALFAGISVFFIYLACTVM